MNIVYKPIGIIHSPFKDIKGMPIQPSRSDGTGGTVEIFPEFVKGLADLEGFSHITLLYYFHKTSGFSLTVTPFLDTRKRGVFSTRAPRRPNPIGLSIVRLTGIEKGVLKIENIDVLDQTPLIDIKPHVPEFDHPPADRIGWLAQAEKNMHIKRSDDRFE